MKKELQKTFFIIIIVGTLLGGSLLYYFMSNRETGDSDETISDEETDSGENTENLENNIEQNETVRLSEEYLHNVEWCNVTLLAYTPTNTPSEDIIYIRTNFGTGLDENDLSMKKIDENLYTLSLLLPKGLIFRYRYCRNGDWDKEESYILRDGRGAHYRVIYIKDNITVEDHIGKWEDLPFSNDAVFSTIKGRVIDGSSKEGIMNLVISAGPYQTLSGYNGTFEIKQVPSNNLTLTIFSDFGTNKEYLPSLFSINILPNETKEITIEMNRTRLCSVYFNVSLPSDTPLLAYPKIFGDYYELGLVSYFEGTAFDVSRIPPMINSSLVRTIEGIEYNTWTFNITAPSGIFLRYLYTLGDPFVNREYGQDSQWIPFRGVYVTDDSVLNDNVSTWKTETMVKVTFNVEAPNADPVSLTFSIWDGWEPLPMWHIGGNNWTYTAFLLKDQNISYRYLRFSDPRVGREKFIDDSNEKFRTVTINNTDCSLFDTILEWRYMMKEQDNTSSLSSLPQVSNRSTGDPYHTGIELVDYYQTPWKPLINKTLATIAETNASWIQIPVVWGILSDDPVLVDYGWNTIPYLELLDHIHQAQTYNLHVAMRPFPYPADDNFNGFNEAHNYSWYDEFFSEIQKCFLYYASIAEKEGVEMLILPNFNWVDSDNSTMASYIDGKWNETISLIRSIYNGKLTIDYFVDRPEYNWYAHLDYLGDKWWVPLSSNTSSTFDDLKNAALTKLSDYYYPLIDRFNKSIIFSEVAYYSANTSEMQLYGVDDPRISEFYPENDTIASAWSHQALAYEAVINAFLETSWVQGSYSFGYFYYDMDCKGYSIRGKSAENTVSLLYGLV